MYTSTGGDVTYWFRYGTSTAYGSETTHRTVNIPANGNIPASEPIPITAGTEYHWQICTQDAQEEPPRTNCSKDQTLYVGPVTCNPITRNTWATNDLADCAPSIGASGVTLNLNGHTFNGFIRNEGFDDVTIENGTAYGVLLTDAAGNRVRDMTLTGQAGNSNSALAVLGDSAGTLISDNTASSGPVTLNVNASDVHVLRNTVSGPGMTASDKEGPLVVRGNDNRIEANTATLDSIGGGRGVGVASILVTGDDNELLGNIASNGLVDGIVVGFQATGTTLIGNVANNNAHEFSFGNGISIEGTGTGTSLGDNTANDNAQLGIAAPSGVTDLGGNHASGNGNPLQCTGVACQP